MSSYIDVNVVVVVVTANCVALAAAAGVGGVTSPSCAGSGHRLSPRTAVDDYDERSSVLSRLHSATASAAGFPPYCSVAMSSQMRPGVQQVRGGGGGGGQAPVAPGPAPGQTALPPYAVGFALGPADMMRQPPLAGFQGIIIIIITSGRSRNFW